jgi:glycosyltransferase involved in cell wall biosynthesis
MQDILNKSLNNVRALEVEVLLATYNGAKFLPDFLASLVRQEGVKIHLRVSDDYSTDETLDILNSFKDSFDSFDLKKGPGVGPAENFFSLIKDARHNYIALADQDDVWEPNHLINSIKRLSNSPDLPSLTFSSVLEFGESLSIERIWPSRYPSPDIRSILTENLGRGCTFVFNSKATKLINIYKPKNAIMHDWWLLLLIYATGSVTWTEEPEVRYRIHQNNAIGNSSSFQTRFRRFILNKPFKCWHVHRQSEELLKSFGWSMNGQAKHQLETFLEDLNSPRVNGRWGAILWRNRYRTSLLSEVVVRTIICFYKRG